MLTHLNPQSFSLKGQSQELPRAPQGGQGRSTAVRGSLGTTSLRAQYPLPFTHSSQNNKSLISFRIKSPQLFLTVFHYRFYFLLFQRRTQSRFMLCIWLSALSSVTSVKPQVQIPSLPSFQDTEAVNMPGQFFSTMFHPLDFTVSSWCH